MAEGVSKPEIPQTAKISVGPGADGEPKGGQEKPRHRVLEVTRESLKKSGGQAGAPSLGPNYKVIYESTVKLGEKTELPVSVYRRPRRPRRPDESLVMSRLPASKYDRGTLESLLKDSGVLPDLELPENWEQLSVDEKRARLKNLGVDTLDEKFNILAPPAPPTPGDMIFKQLLLEKWDILRQPAAQQNQQRLGELDNEIQRRVNQGDPWHVGTADRDLSEVLVSIRHDPNLRNEFNTQVMDIILQQRLTTTKQLMDENFEVMLDQLAGTAKFPDIQAVATDVLNGLTSGWRTENEARILLYDKALESRDTPGSEGMRSWFASKQLETVLRSAQVLRRTRVQADPHANIKAAEEAMIFFEQSQNIEGFALARQRLTDLRYAVEHSSDLSVTDEMKDRLRKRIEAFQVVSPIFITMRQREGDPRAMQEAVAPVTNETFFNFFDRFSELRDADGNLYFVDVNGNDLGINFLNENVKVGSHEYQVDRYRENLVQEMTKRNLDINTADADEQWLINYLQTHHPHLVLNDAWNDDDTKKGAVQAWYTEQTLIGVDGFAPNSSQELKDVREDILMQTALRDRLINVVHVDPDRVNDLLGILQNPNLPYDPVTNPVVIEGNYELIQAVKAITSNFLKFTMVSSLDRLRVYSKDNDNGEFGRHSVTGDTRDPVTGRRIQGKRLVASLFGEETPFYMRETDQITDFFFSEKHGDENVNKVIRRATDEKWRGFFLASNQLLFRIVNQLANKDQLYPGGMLPAGVRQRIDTAVRQELGDVGARTGLRNLEKAEVEAYVIMDMIYRYNPNNPNDPTTLDISLFDWTQSSKELDTYMFNDNANDRVGTSRWYREEFKAFTFQPFHDQLFAVLDKYYSSRHIRKRQAMDFFLDVYMETGQHWKEWLDYKDNITNVQMETIIQEAIEHNVLDKPRAEAKKTQLLGNPVIREAKQWVLFLYEGLKDLVRPASLLGGFWDWLKTLYVYLTQLTQNK